MKMRNFLFPPDFNRQGDYCASKDKGNGNLGQRSKQEKILFIIKSLDYFFVQTCLRHPDCPSARENRDTVFCQVIIPTYL